MAQPTNTYDTYDAIGIREDLSNAIYNISPTDTPVLTMCPKAKATNTLHEWQTDALGAASATNAVIEGDEATLDAMVATTRLGNYTQISDKTAVITGTQESVTKAGRANEMGYQIAKVSAELKRDMESSLCANNARVAGNATTAREFAGIPSWLATNTDIGTGAAADPTGDGTDARTDGTQRAFAESQLKTVLQAIWTAGGQPDCVMTGAFNKRKLSGFSGGRTSWQNADDKKITAAVDIYVSDWGEVKIIPNRFMRARDVLVLQKDMWAIAMLRPFKVNDLARTGDTEKKQLLVEYTLEARNEASSGIVADLTTS